MALQHGHPPPENWSSTPAAVCHLRVSSPKLTGLSLAICRELLFAFVTVLVNRLAFRTPPALVAWHVRNA